MSTIRRRLVPSLILFLVAAAACTPPAGGGTTSTSTTTTSPPSTWTPGACPTSSGVTVVVDTAAAGSSPVVRCALGASSTGLVALARAGFGAVGEPGVAPVCTIDGYPSQGFPFCWYTGGYWSYWSAPVRGAPWQFATTGPGAGPVPQGSVQGWAWAPGFVSDGPRVGSDGD